MSELSERIAALPQAKRAALMALLLRQPAVEVARDVYDVVILGGGMAGLTLALQMTDARPATRIAVVERQRHPVPEAAHKVGESTVEICAHYLRDVLGLGDHLRTRQLRKFGLRMFFSTDGNHDITHRGELGSTVFPPLHTYQLDRGRLENELGELLRRRGIEFIDGCRVRRISLQPDQELHEVHLAGDDVERDMRTRWVVDASGRTGLLKRQLGLAKKVGHHANAVWFRVGYPIDVKQWTTDPAWQARVSQGDRALSTNHLMGAGYWVWLIRLASDSISVGIVTDAAVHTFREMAQLDRALNWLRQHEPQCAAEIDRRRDEIKDFRVMRDYSYSCEQVFSGDRWCLAGEAGVALDPLYSPGGDLIAIGNGLICDLITRHLDGEDIRSRASVHDQLFLNIARIWLRIYEQQYGLMDNAQIMTTKIIWDTAFYWGVFGLLYFHDTFRRITDSPSVAQNLSRIAHLNNRIQAFFREWYAVARPAPEGRFVDLYAPLDFMQRLHTGMAADLADRELDAQFAANVEFFERLAGMVIGTVIEMFASELDDEAIVGQIQQWQTEPYVAELMARHRRRSRTEPIENHWVTLGKPVLSQVGR